MIISFICQLPLTKKETYYIIVYYGLKSIKENNEQKF